MVPFHQMAGSAERVKANVEAYSETMRDVNEALAGDPAGPTKNYSSDRRQLYQHMVHRARAANDDHGETA